MHNSKPLRWFVFGLLAVIIAIRLSDHVFDARSLMIAGLIIEIIFLAVLCVVIIGHIMKASEVEAVAGQIYLTVLAARLVGLNIFYSHTNKNTES